MKLIEKVTILKLMLDKKEMLFGQFTPSLTLKDKDEAWGDIVKKALAMAINLKDSNYFRHTTWQNWRRATLSKKDNNGKTGKPGGSANQYNEADTLILEIIGTDSPVLDGLPIQESSGTDQPTINILPQNPDSDSEEHVGTLALTDGTTKPCQTPMTSKSNTQPPEKEAMTPKTNVTKRIRTVRMVEKDLLTLKKIGSQIGMLERQEYNMDLDILKKERDLKVGPSKFTAKFYGIEVLECIPETEALD